MPRLTQPSSRIKLTNVSIVKLTVDHNSFELACYPNKISDWRAGKETDLFQVLQSHKIFTNVSKGQFARDQDLKNCFGTANWHKCVMQILNEGEAQLTSKERKQNCLLYANDIFRLVSVKIMSASTGLVITAEQVENECKKYNIYPKISNSVPAKIAANNLVMKLTRKSNFYLIPRLSFVQILSIGDKLDNNFVHEIKNKLISLFTTYDLIITSHLIKFYCFTVDVESINLFFETEKSIKNLQCSIKNLSSQDFLQISDLFKNQTDLNVQTSNHSTIEPNNFSKEIDNEKIDVTNYLDNQSTNEKSEVAFEKKNLVMADSEETQCRICQIDIESIKQHSKSDLHIFNLKRKYQNLPRVSSDMFKRLDNQVKINYSTFDEDKDI